MWLIMTNVTLKCHGNVIELWDCGQLGFAKRLPRLWPDQFPSGMKSTWKHWRRAGHADMHWSKRSRSDIHFATQSVWD
jgi:hypothetical protein